jgi:hypothetical protein
MGLFFFRKEIEREQFAQRLDSLESQIELLDARIQYLLKNSDITKEIQNEVHKQIQAAKAVEKAHESFPSLSKRMKVKRYSGTFAQTYYDRPFQIAMEMQGKYVQREIADKLNDYGFKTPQGNEFKQGNVSDMLSNKWLLSRFHRFEQKHGKLHEPVDFIHGLS